MVWKQPNNDQREQDPWDQKKRNSLDKLKKNNKKVKCFLKELSNIRRFLRDSFRIVFSRFQFSRTMNNPIIVFLVIFAIVYVMSGLYIIKEAERGVITYFGQFSHLVKPGLNWRPLLLSTITPVNIEESKELLASGVLLTADENFIQTEINVQYRITNPRKYLFSVMSAENNLQHIIDSTLRIIIGSFTIDHILFKDPMLVSNSIKKEVEMMIVPYNMGITILGVNVNKLCPPKEVKSSFDDVITAKENTINYIQEAETYVNEVIFKANAQAKSIIAKAKSKGSKEILESEGEIIKFFKILPEYKRSKIITAKRLYIKSMEKIFSHAKKVLVSNNEKDKIYFLLDKSVFNQPNFVKPYPVKKDSKKTILHSIPILNKNKIFTKKSKIRDDNIMEQRRIHAFRIDNFKEGRKLNNE